MIKNDEAQIELDTQVRSLRLPKSNQLTNQKPKYTVWLVAFIAAGAVGWLCLSKYGNFRSPQTIRKASRGTNVKDPATLASKATTLQADAKPKSSLVRSGETIETKLDVRPNLKGVTIAMESRGYVLARHQVLVSPQVSGRILALHLEEGLAVKQGDILAVIDATQYRSEFEQTRGAYLKAEAELRELQAGARPQEIAMAQAQLNEQLAVLEKLKADYQRQKNLSISNASSESELEAAESAYRSLQYRVDQLTQNLEMLKEGPRKERIDMAQALLMQSKAAMEKAQWQLDNCEIRSPISGTILRKNAEEGNLVNAAAFNGSFSICEVADLSDLEVELNVQERDIAKVFLGQACEVRTEAFPDHPYRATVSRLMPIADRAKGSIAVRVAIAVPEEEQGIYLKPEMSALVVFYKADEKLDAISDP